MNCNIPENKKVFMSVTEEIHYIIDKIVYWEMHDKSIYKWARLRLFKKKLKDIINESSIIDIGTKNIAVATSNGSPEIFKRLHKRRLKFPPKYKDYVVWKYKIISYD